MEMNVGSDEDDEDDALPGQELKHVTPSSSKPPLAS